MNKPIMTLTHHCAAAPWSWPVATATALPAAPVARWLVVGEGRVWLTRSRRQAGLSDDIWLAAGQRLLLPPGSDWVIEAWPSARVELLQAPPGVSERGARWVELGRVWRAGWWRPRRRPTRQPASPLPACA